MPAEKHPTATLIERLFSAIGCGVLGGFLGVVLMFAVFNLTEPAVDLGFLPSIYCGCLLGTAFGFAFPRVGEAILYVLSFFIP